MAGRLTQAEFAERVETAYAARVGDELALTQKPLPNVAIAPAVGPRRKPTRLTPAVFRHVIKRGSWRLRRWSLAASVFSDLDLDVRGAERDTTHSVITVLVAFGNADVYVPDDIDVTVGGSASSADGVRLGPRHGSRRRPNDPGTGVIAVRNVRPGGCLPT